MTVVHLGGFSRFVESLILAAIQYIGDNILPILVLYWSVLGSLPGGLASAPHNGRCTDGRSLQVGIAGFGDVCHRQS